MWVDLHGFLGQEGFFEWPSSNRRATGENVGLGSGSAVSGSVKGSVVEQKKMILCVGGLPFELLAEALVAGAELVFLQEPQSVD